MGCCDLRSESMSTKRIALMFAAAGLLAGCETARVAPPSAPDRTNTPAPPRETPPPETPTPAPPPVPPPPASPAAQQQAQKIAMQAVELLEVGNEGQATIELQRALEIDPYNKLALNLMRQITADPQATLGRESFAYTVRPSDTLSRIAKTFMGDAFAFYILARYNGIEVPRRVASGQVIRIPGKAPPPGSEPPHAPPSPPTPPAPAPAPVPVPAPAPAPAPVPPPPAPPPPAPTAGEVAFARGEAAEKAGRLDAAFEEFQAAATLNHPGAAARASRARSNLITARLRQAREAMASQNPKAAIPLYDRVLVLDPGNDTAKLERQRAVELVKKTGG